MGQGEVGGAPEGIATSVRKALVCTGWSISVLFGINGLRNKQSHLVGPPFPAFKACFSAAPGWYLPEALIESALRGEWLESRISLG